MAYAAIDVGSSASDRAATPVSGNSTRILEANPVNASGVLTSFEVYFATDGTDLYIGSFQDGGSYSYTMRDYEYIASVTGGSKQTFTGKNCDVVAGDKLGSYWATGTLEKDDSGSGVSSRNFNNDFTTTGTFTYSFVNNRTYSLYATGVTLADAPTNVSATENDSSKVTITWTKSTGATGYRVYRDGADISGLLGDVATYDDTGAAAPVITAGAASAADGISQENCALSLSGNSIANGTQYTYTVKAVNAAGLSAASSSDTGYRLAASVTYQWQRSAGDSDADYSDISGATTASYNDTGGQAGAGYYYKCALSATGSTTVYSTADRGYKGAQETSFIQEIMRVFYTP